MKHRFYLVLCFCMALGILAHAQKVTMNFQQVKLETVFQEITKQTGLTVAYSRPTVDPGKVVSVNAHDEELAGVLQRLFVGTDVTFEIGKQKIFLNKRAKEKSTGQVRRVSGSIVDSNGEPIIGASIVVTGTTNGTISDLDGKYTLDNVPENATLDVSYIGYTTQSLKATDKALARIILKEDTKVLDEVVVVGYGVAKKSDFTGSLNTMNGDNIVSSHKQSATAALQGTIPGVDIIRNGNNPGSGFNIMIRGQNTIASGGTGSMSDINPPLYIVDGIMLSSIDDIAPDDIERIDVLKDASSTAIYGSRGANGVVIVTTKKGSQGEGKSYVEYNGFVSLTQAMHLPDMMNGQQWADYKVDRYTGEHWTEYLHGEPDPTYQQVLTTQQYNNLMAGKNIDWVDELLGVAFSQNHSLRAYGNSKDMVYSFGLSYTDESGVTGVDNYKRYNFSASVDRNIGKKVKIGLNMYSAYSQTISSAETVRQAYRLNGLSDMYNEDGSLRVFPDDALGNVSNPLVERENNQSELLNLHVFGNTYFQYQPFDWMTFKTTFSPDVYFQRTGSYAGKDSKNGKGQAANATAGNDWKRSLSYTWTNVLTFDKSFNDKHAINAMLGTEWVKNVSDGLNSEVKGFASDHYKFYNLAAGTNISELTSDYLQDQWMSYFARLNYTLRGKYLFTVTGRYDGSSRLAEGHRWKFFPSAAIGWRITEEDFMKSADWVNNLKLRLSYGLSGNNSNVSPYMTSTNVNNLYYIFGGGTPTTASVISNMANRNLSWETTKEWNLGLDFGFLGGRISGSIDLYNRRTDNILMDRVMSRMNGFDSVIDNVGVVDNRGVELSLSTVNVKTKNFTWSTNLNFTTNHNEIIELSDGKQSDEANGWFVGESVGAVWTYKHVGYWGMDEIEEAAKYGLVPGSIKVLEVNGDHSSTNADKVIIGNRFPKWTGGMTNTFTYKDWSLSAFIYTRQGQISYSQFHWTTALNDNTNFNHMNLNYWTPETAETAEWHRAGITTPGETDAIMWQETSFWKVGYITLGYDLPKKVRDRLRLNKCHIYLSCQNPFVFTDYKGWDPEAADKATDTSYFMTRSFVLGLNLSF